MSMNKLGLTEERYNQMMKLYNNDEDAVADIVYYWGAESCNKGYDVFNYDSIGIVEIEAIGEVGAYTDDEAVEQAIKDGIKIIPVEELPDNMPEDMRFYGWIDTKENRKNIEEYCIDC